MPGKQAVLPLLQHQAKSDYSQNDATPGSYSHIFIWTCIKVGWIRNLWHPNANGTRATTGQQISRRSGNILAPVWLYSFWQVVWSLTILFVALLCDPNKQLFCNSFCLLKMKRGKQTIFLLLWCLSDLKFYLIPLLELHTKFHRFKDIALCVSFFFKQ